MGLDDGARAPSQVGRIDALILGCDYGQLRQAERRHVRSHHGLMFTAPHWSVGGHRVWGATSMILSELVAVLEG